MANVVWLIPIVKNTIFKQDNVLLVIWVMCYLKVNVSILQMMSLQLILIVQHSKITFVWVVLKITILELMDFAKLSVLSATATTLPLVPVLTVTLAMFWEVGFVYRTRIILWVTLTVHLGWKVFLLNVRLELSWMGSVDVKMSMLIVTRQLHARVPPPASTHNL